MNTLHRIFVVVALMSVCVLAALSQTYIVSPMTGGYAVAKPGAGNVEATVKLTNYGTAEITKFTYTLYYLDTQESVSAVEKQLDAPLLNGETAIVKIPIKPGSALGSSDVIFTVSTVNGQTNNASVTYTYITRYTMRKIPRKKVLMEYHGGLWCPNCPPAHVLMSSLARLYPDDYVGVNVHYTDNLSTPVANESGLESTWGSGKPAVWCARKTNLKAQIDGRDIFKNELGQISLTNLNVKAHWDATGNNVVVSAEVEPCAQLADGNEYALAYVMTVSGVKSKIFNQLCYYSNWQSFLPYDSALEPEMSYFLDQSNYNSNSRVTGLTFNDVALCAKDYNKGVDGSLPDVMQVGELYTHQVTFENIPQFETTTENITKGKFVTDRSQLKVVAVLLNKKTNQVENVASCSIANYEADFSLSFADSNWLTLYTDRAYNLPLGVTAYKVDAAGQLAEVANGSGGTSCAIAAYTPLLLKADERRTYTFAYTENAATAVEGNALRGTLQDEETSPGIGRSDNQVYYYKLSYDDTGKNIGFYWANDGGAAFTNAAGKSYLVLDHSAVAASQASGFAIDSDVTTGVNGIEMSAKSHDGIYGINGQAVSRTTLPGVYIVNGKKVVVK